MDSSNGSLSALPLEIQTILAWHNIHTEQDLLGYSAVALLLLEECTVSHVKAIEAHLESKGLSLAKRAKEDS